MRAGSADKENLVASKYEARKRNHYARPGQPSINERKYKLAALAVKSLQAYSTVQGSTVQKRTAQHSTVQYSTVQYSTVQHSTEQYSNVQCSTCLLYTSPSPRD